MTFFIRDTRVAIPANTTGNFDITISGMGTPKAAMFILTFATADGTAAPMAVMSVGSTDGTNQWAAWGNSTDGQAATSVSARGMTDQCVILGTSAAGLIGEASFVSMITDGVRINISNDFSVVSSYLLTVVFFGGDELECETPVINLGTATTAQTVNTLAREYDLLIAFSIGEQFNDTGVSRMQTILGLIHNNGAGTITQRSMGIAEANLAADGQPVARMMEDKGIFQLAAATGAVDYEVAFSNFTSSGFDFQSNANAGSDRVGLVCLSFPGRTVNVFTYEPPTSATTSSIPMSGGETPEFTMLGLNGCTAVDTAEQDGDAGVFGIAVMDATSQFCNSIAIEDASATTDTQSMSDNQAIKLPAHDGASDLYAGTFSSFSGAGTNLSFSAASGTTRKWIGWSVGQATSNRRRRLICS